MNIAISAGHSKSGTGCGAIGFLNESTENRNVKNEVIRLLKIAGCVVHDCTIDTCTSSNALVKAIVNKHNSYTRDLDVQIHFNAGVSNKKSDGYTTGTETLVYSKGGSSTAIANRVCNNISKLGFKNRGVKERTDLWFLKKTSKPAILIECCFVDDEDDAKLYNCAKMARAIAEAIVNKAIVTTAASSTVTFLVRIKVDELNVRAGAGISYKINRTVKRDEVFTVVETKMADGVIWGKLKSGAGWISLHNNYVTRL